METATYTKGILIEQTECDLKNRMTLGALLRRAQQAATGHCDAVGVTTAYLLGYHAAFLLVKASVETARDLRPGEKLRVITEPSAPAHAFYNRFTGFYGEDGALAAAVDSRWVLADIEAWISGYRAGSGADRADRRRPAIEAELKAADEASMVGAETDV